MKYKAHTQYKNKENKRVPGTTTITSILNKPALVPWANRMGLQGIDTTKYTDDKAEIGTLGHAMVTDKLEGKTTDTSDYSQKQIDKAENCALSFWEWAKGKTIEPILIEKPLVSEKYQYGGTMDIYAKVDGIKELVDLKTGSGIFEEMFYQVGGGYRQILIENGYEVERIRILNIPRAGDESFKEEVKKNCELYWKIFYHCLKIYNLKKQIGR